MIVRPVLAAVALVLTTGAPAPATEPVAASGCSARVEPGDALGRALRAAGPGATVCFGPGTYRLTRPLRPLAGQTLEGAGARLVGSRVLTGTRRTPQGWVRAGQRQEGERTGTCRDGIACTYPDDVLRDGRLLRRVLNAGALHAGTYWFDYARDRIVLADDPAGHRVEALVAPAAVQSRPGGSDVTVRGFRIERFATPAQHGAIDTAEPGWRVEGTTVARNHGAGITTQGGAEVVGNRVTRNGQLGIGGTGADTLVQDNRIDRNGRGGFDPAWEAGGAKWALTTHLVVVGNHVARNRGPGLWTDIDAQDTTYAENTVVRNTGAGIFHEISAGARILDNVVTGNGRGDDSWLWGAGIQVAGSHDVEVAGNRLSDNRAGITLVQQERGSSEVDGTPRLLHDVRITGNTVDLGGGPTGAVTDNGYDRLFTDPTITWSANTWTGAAGRPFWWDDRELSLAEWQALGHDG